MHDIEPSQPSTPPAAPARVLTPSRASIERWRLTPEGRVQDSESSDVARVIAACMHLWPIYAAVLPPLAPLVPLCLWIAFRKRAPLVDDHGREVLNSILTLLLLVCVPCVGWLALVPWVPVWLVSLVRGAIAGGSGELFRYPAILRAIR
jgi:uncharacterized Tic20 family protein